MVLGQLDIYMQKNKLDTFLTPHPKISLKLVINLNIGTKTIKLKKKKGIHFWDFGSPLDKTSKAQVTRKGWYIGHHQD